MRQGIRELSSEVRDYRELTAKKQAMLEGNAKYQARANTLTEEIRRILLSYNALDQTLPYNICLQNLRKRFDGYREATERLARYTQDFESTSSRKMQANALVEQFLAKYQLREIPRRTCLTMQMRMYIAENLPRKPLPKLREN